MMKRILSVLALICVLAMCVPVFAEAETVKLAYAGGSLSLRKGAGTNYARNGYLRDGDRIEVLSYGSVWSKVETYDGRVGYIKNLYISGNGKNNYADGTSYYGTKVSGRVSTTYASSSVNLRSGASTSTSKITSLASGTKLTILGENGSWYLVSTASGTQGYISKSYVKKTGSSSSSSSSTTATVSGSVVNMRKGPGTDYALVTALTKGTRVTVLSKSNSRWWKVKYSSYTGYMSSNYLK